MDKEQKMRLDKVEYVGDRIIITGDELPILRTVIVDSIVGKVDLLHNNINYKAIELGKDLMDYFRQEDKIKIEKLKRENEELKTQLKKYTISEKEKDNTNKIETLNKLGNYNFYNLGFKCIEEMADLTQEIIKRMTRPWGLREGDEGVGAKYKDAIADVLLICNRLMEHGECKQEVIKNMEVKLKRAIEKELEMELKRQQLSGD